MELEKQIKEVQDRIEFYSNWKTKPDIYWSKDYYNMHVKEILHELKQELRKLKLKYLSKILVD